VQVGKPNKETLPFVESQDFCLGTYIVGISTFQYTTQTIFALMNGLKLNDTALHGFLGLSLLAASVQSLTIATPPLL
jgi:hypothetical protein